MDEHDKEYYKLILENNQRTIGAIHDCIVEQGKDITQLRARITSIELRLASAERNKKE